MTNDNFDKMVRAMQKVHERLLRSTAALEKAIVPYAVVDGQAVAAWISQVDEAAVRNSQDVDILLRRDDLPAATKALAEAGFVYRQLGKLQMFLDGPDAKPRDAVRIVFAGEPVAADSSQPAPDVSEWIRIGQFRAVNLLGLVRMKLSSYRLRDRVHLLDMWQVGLIDEGWLGILSPELAERLDSLMENPDQ